jgi:hypothetical protein
MFRAFAFACTLALLSSVCLRALTMNFTGEGLRIEAGGVAGFTLAYPQLLDEAGREPRSPVGKTLSETEATFTYDGGATVRVVALAAEGSIAVHVTPGSELISRVSLQTTIPFQFSEGGTWQVDDGAETAFPARQPHDPRLYGGQGTRIALTSGDGHGLALRTPLYGWNELVDFRQWNWKIFAWKLIQPIDPAHPHFRIEVSAFNKTGSTPAPFRFDRFGQSVSADWPGKLRSEAALKADRAREAAYYTAFRPPPLDRFGGLPGSGTRLGLHQTGFFHVEQKDGRWHLVNPDGNLFFHIGICVFSPTSHTYIGGRHSVFEWIPPAKGAYQTTYRDYGNGRRAPDEVSFYLANLVRKYDTPIDDETFSARMISRVRAWGFNSTGAFSGPPLKAWRDARFPYVAELPVHPWDGVPHLPGLPRVIDPFDEAVRAKFDALCAEHVAPLAGDPLLIGYFLENEPLYEELTRIVPGLNGSDHACKRRLVQLLRDTHGTIDAFKTAWAHSARDFDQLLDEALPVTTAAARADLQAYAELFFETYFSWMKTTVRKHDPNHLLIGNRLQTGTINDEALCRIMGRHLDVVSINYYTYGIDADFLGKIHRWTGGRPMILSEFYWGSAADSGLPGAIRETDSQRDRGLAYRHYVEQAAALGYVVGVEWFTLVDQPASGVWWGKEQGENGNTGLFDIADRPWRDAVAEMAKTNHDIYSVILGKRPPFVFEHPRFKPLGDPGLTVQIARADGPVVLDGRTRHWPGLPATPLGARLTHGTQTGGLEAGFKTCHDGRRLYVHVQVADATPQQNTRTGADLWMGDCVELFLGHENIDQDGPLLSGDRHVLISASSDAGGTARIHVVGGKDASASGIEAVCFPAPDGKGYIVQAAIHFDFLGVSPKPATALRFDLAVDDSADGARRARQLMWNGTDRNSADRGTWGRAVLR